MVQSVCKPLNTKGLPLGISVEEALKQCKMFKKLLSESEVQMAGQMLMANGARGTPEQSAREGAPEGAPEEDTSNAAADEVSDEEEEAPEVERPAPRRTRRRLH